MPVIKLDNSHSAAVINLIDSCNSGAESNVNVEYSGDDFIRLFLSDSNSFHAYGFLSGDSITAIIAFYESSFESAWFYMFEYSKSADALCEVLDTVIAYNEKKYRAKFYMKIRNMQHRMRWSEYNSERYSYIDEYVIPSNGMCFYDHHNDILFLRKLIPGDIVVRCNFLKQEHRAVLPLGGNI
ncbi:MAG: hypothetical protein WCR20_17595 [Verrucomicrobiota bacterium]